MDRVEDADGAPYALKWINLLNAKQASDATRDTFEREAHAFRSLEHTNIVRTIDSGRLDDELLYLRLEWLPDTLGAVERRLSLQEVSQLGLELARALDYLDDKRVLHRDIHPGNIAFDAGGRAKLLDFGLASFRAGGTQRHGSAIVRGYGCPGYAPVEQLVGGLTGLAGDLYAFGAVLYERLAGHGHLEGRCPDDSRESLARWYAQPHRPLPPDAARPPALDALLERCLRLEPGDRPRSARHVLDRMKRIAGWVQAGETPDILSDDIATLRDTWARADAEAREARSTLASLKRAAAEIRDVRAEHASLLAEVDTLARRRDALQGEVSRRPLPRSRLAMVPIPGGAFLMGSPADEPGRIDWESQHRVTVSPFLMAATPVTVGDYASVLGAEPEGAAGHPRVSVNWEEAVAWCNRLSLSEGLTEAYAEGDLVPGADGYRLPTEAEWEYACRAGTQTPWWTGANEASLDRAAWYDANAGGTTHPVGEKAANRWGLYDVHGNVWEWCHDWYADYLTKPQTDPTGPPTGGRRVIRGGAFGNPARRVRAAGRNRSRPGSRRGNLGFRVVRRPRP